MTATLLAARRFLPLFATQTLGALNDNLLKNALAVLVVFQLAEGAGQGGLAGPALAALAGGAFILPYALFSALAGQLADSRDKAWLIRWTKWGEVALALLAAAGFLLGSVPLLFLMLFGLGTQATFFSPLKYGILPDHLDRTEVVSGNALIEAGTFAGILAGTIAGGVLILLPHGAALISAAGILVALAGVAAAFSIPPAPPRAAGLPVQWNPVPATASILRDARANRPIWLATLGLSWFWTLGSIFLAEFPVLAHDRFVADSHVVTLMLAGFAVGVGVGSVGIGRALKGEVSARHVPFMALGLAVFAADFAWVCHTAGPGTGWHDVPAMLHSPRAWRLLFDLFMVAACGGAFSVPLYAIIQESSAPAMRSRMVAANNVVNAAAMAGAAVIAAALPAVGVLAPGILGIVAAGTLVVAGVCCLLLPQEVMRSLARWWFTRLHGVEVRGLEHYRAAGDRAVVVCNHVSFADGCLLAAFVPDRPVFAVHSLMVKKWWAQPFLAPVDVFPVDPTNPFSVRGMVREVEAGRRLVIFPEGRLTQTGSLMKIYEGAGLVADKSGAVVVPARIEGLQYSFLSRMGGKLRRRLFPRLTLTFLPPQRLAVPDGLAGRPRRRAVGSALQDLMEQAAFAGSDREGTLFRALIDAADRHGPSRPIAEDLERAPLTYRRLLLGAVVLGRKLAPLAPEGGRIGVMLPNANGALTNFCALQAFGRVPAMLNYSAGAEAMLSACAAAEVGVVLASRRFVEKAKLDRTMARMAEQVRFVWLEDLRAGITRGDKLRGLWDARRPHRLPGAQGDGAAPAVVLFTSGSEGAPKGVVLSHRNLRANLAQLAATIDFSPADRVLNAMPMFHSFGLTGGTLLPLLNGVRTFFYPSPLHYRIVPEVAYDSDATIVFGTDTFLTGWARFAHPYDFRSVRYVVAGAERVREETKRTYMDRFGVRVLEGYGATETAPVIALNTPMHGRTGTVGRLLPGLTARLEPVPGIAEGGRLHVHGPNVMLGYLRATAPGVLEPPPGGWYDTGDIVAIDADGFVRIQGRAKRFAKIAGEMVSMSAAEALATALWPEAGHAVVALPDPRKGERLLLLTTQPGADARTLLAHAREAGTPEIAVPRGVQVVSALPLLGTGKVDYPAVQALAEAGVQQDAA